MGQLKHGRVAMFLTSFEAVPHCFIDSYGPLLRKFFLMETSARKLEERNFIKINNKTQHEIVIEE